MECSYIKYFYYSHSVFLSMCHIAHILFAICIFIYTLRWVKTFRWLLREQVSVIISSSSLETMTSFRRSPPSSIVYSSPYWDHFQMYPLTNPSSNSSFFVTRYKTRETKWRVVSICPDKRIVFREDYTLQLQLEEKISLCGLGRRIAASNKERKRENVKIKGAENVARGRFRYKQD